jgi:arylsulfatase A-like enzyme
MTAPNIILLIFDDCSFENLQRMPQLAKLGLTGVSFANAMCNTPLCQPARVTLLSGQYSHNHGVLDNDLTGFPLDHTTLLARRLQLAGYQTSHIGKFFNSWPIASAIPSGWNDWHQMTEIYTGYQINDNGVVTTAGGSIGEYNTNKCTTKALSFIAGATPPFFMQVAYKAPHPEHSGYPNITPDPRYAGVTPESRIAPRNPNFNVTMGTPPAYMAHTAIAGTDLTNIDAFYRGQTETLYSVDQSIKTIVAAAPANTVFIVTSDHAWMRGEGMDPASKMVPYLQDLHIPMIISGPSGLVAQNQVCSQLVSHVDVTATIYALSGATSVRAPDGISLAPLLTNPAGAAALRNYMLLEFLGTTGFPTANGGTGWTVKVPAWSSVISLSDLYTLYATGEQELYDLIADPFQLLNQINVPAYAKIKADLSSRLSAMQSCSGSSCVI